MMDFLVDENSDFTHRIIHKDAKDHVREVLNKELTELESTVLEGYEQDKPYKDIARELGVDDKCVDNSLARIRNKVIKLCQDNEFVDGLEEDVLGSIIYRSNRKGRSR
jgi:DNA-directed RNA polymerase specialized sigma24 family protein